MKKNLKVIGLLFSLVLVGSLIIFCIVSVVKMINPSLDKNYVESEKVEWQQK